MKSIWGNYNRNSPHNFKKNNGAASVGEESMQQLVAKDLAQENPMTSKPTTTAYITYETIHGIDRSQLEEMFKFSVA